MRAALTVLTSSALAALFLLVGACSSDPAAGDDDSDAGPVIRDDGGVIISPDAAPAAPLLAEGVRIRDIALFQSIKQPLVTAGQPAGTPAVPVLPGRGGAMRIYVDALPAPRTVTAELTIGTRSFTSSGTLSAASSDAVAASVLSIPITPDAFTAGARWSVRLTAADGVAIPTGTASDARYPRDGSDLDLGVAAPTTLRIVLVPLRYDTDGSGRLPDTSPTQLERYRALLTALYPLSTVEFTVHAPLPWSTSLNLSGDVRFGSINDALIDLRAAENAPRATYYYGLVAPAVNFGTYCGNGCVSGQSYVITTPSNSSTRVGSGLGFVGERSAWTMAHEVGHIHGRSHAPCGVSSFDASYPYQNGVTGVWGFDARSGTFIAPTATDFMGYCDDEWISDYTYAALYQRMRALEALTP